MQNLRLPELLQTVCRAEVRALEADEQQERSAASMELQASEEETNAFGECTQSNKRLIMAHLTQAQQRAHWHFEQVERQLGDLGRSGIVSAQAARTSQEYDRYRDMVQQMPTTEFTQAGCEALHNLIAKRLQDLIEKIASLLDDEEV